MRGRRVESTRAPCLYPGLVGLLLLACSGADLREEAVHRPLLLHADPELIRPGSREAAVPSVVVAGGVERIAYRAHAPASLHFADVAVPDGARLHVAIAVRDGDAQRSDGVEFAVSVRTDEVDEQEIWSRVLRPSSVPGDRGWQGVQIELGAFAGRSVDLSFETRSLRTASFDQAAWAEPVIAGVERPSVDPQSSVDGPNVLLVVVDTLRADRTSLNGVANQTTPTLERLAETGVTFDLAFSASSWTLPATASLLTGLYPTEHGVTDGRPLPRELETPAERFRAAGFVTMAISANPIVGPTEGFDQGFDRFIQVPWARAESVNRLFAAFLRERGHDRWFGYLHYIDPHDPYDAPRSEAGDPHRADHPLADPGEFRALVEGVNFGSGDRRPRPGDIDYLLDAYDAEIAYWDGQFDELLRAFEPSVLERTVIVVTSDHGEEFLEHGKLKHGLQLFDESLHVPLLVWSSDMESGVRVADLVETRAVVSHWLESWASGEMPDPLAAPRPRAGVYFGHTGHALLEGEQGRREMVAARSERWKAVRIAGAPLSLFDLRADPEEMENVGDEWPRQAERWSTALDGWLAATTAIDSEPPDADALARLRALGYIE